MAVTIIDFKERQNTQGETFFALILQGELDLVKSSVTGKLYATAKRTSITSTFDEMTCKALIGKKLPGSIKKIECETYTYTVPETGDIVTIAYRYEYSNEPTTVEEEVFEM